VVRSALRRSLLTRATERAHPLDPADLDGATLVLAPHPDDETLGSGGLVARLRDLDRPVHIVFMTDGAGSHPILEPQELASRRREEATRAAAVLGVGPEHLDFLDIRDGTLADHRDEAVANVGRVLDEVRPERVVLPHRSEPNRDHAATNDVAAAAVRRSGRPLQALAYLVWFWDQWPFTNPLSEPRVRHTRRQVLETAREGRLGLTVTRRLTHAVDVAGVLDRKRAALAEHRSQTARPEGQDEWLTLADVAGGDWLDLLLQPVELYAVGELAP
jgi:LmbE family N-acetylglucosaminyl deacetylase